MGKIAKKKKKGRPSKADIARRSAGFTRNPVVESDNKRSVRHRNLTYTYDFDDEEDEEGSRRRRRREKKLKLVLRVQQSRIKDEGFSRVDSLTSQMTQAATAEEEGRRGRRKLDQTCSENSSEEYGNDNKTSNKKRKIDGEDDVYDYGDDDYVDDDDKGLVRSRDQMKKERGHNADSKGMDSVPGVPLPDRQQLELILDKLQRKDTYGVFAEPVDPEELPDYHDVIEHPMDFGTIRKKLANGTYSNLEELENDVFLVCLNAMQYNAPETIYFKQAHSIQELARKKFQRLRIGIERSDAELKSEQKPKFNSSVKRPANKSLCRPLQEPVGSDFSSGATLATLADTCTLSNPAQAGGCDGPVNENSSLTENKADEAEEQLSGKGFPSKFGRKHFVIDENRRATYSISNQPVVSTESIFTTFEGETEQLVAVGLHADHSYARSMARFAATLGPVAWKVASWRIEKALPVGMKFGRGWVGEYEPLPTPVLMLGNHTREQRVTNSQKTTESRTTNSSVVAASSKSLDPAKDYPLSRPVPESKPSLFGVAGAKPIFHATNQVQNQLTMNFTKLENISKQNELNCSSSTSEDPQNISSRNQLEHDSEMKTARQIEMDSRNRNLLHPISFTKPETDGRGLISTNSDRVSRCSDLVSNLQARAGNYSPRGNHHQGLNDPNQMIRMLAEKTQQQAKSSNPPTIDTRQVMVSAPSSRRDDSSAAATAAARAWMSLGATQFKPLESSDPPKMQITAASLYNPAREFSQSFLQFRGEPPSGGLQLQSLNRFHPQLPGSELHFQNNRQMVFPQIVTANLSHFQVQSPRQGLIQHTQTNKRRDMLPPDLNISFQSSGSPVKRSSGILADSQQPDLALQL
ncbi:Bromodomain [Macleaya cordata]|uniref:Bromodomain n=1 Tax=Macleaya cordata TaxID=56857 RepID=A0A200PYX5_MACCD|nr:Bromodomain [Macleaya cordata]